MDCLGLNGGISNIFGGDALFDWLLFWGGDKFTDPCIFFLNGGISGIWIGCDADLAAIAIDDDVVDELKNSYDYWLYWQLQILQQRFTC